jgi:hypothetical protein
MARVSADFVAGPRDSPTCAIEVGACGLVARRCVLRIIVSLRHVDGDALGRGVRGAAEHVGGAVDEAVAYTSR